jgi:hypothetical protein
MQKRLRFSGSKRLAEVWGVDIAVLMEQIVYWLRLNSKKPGMRINEKVWFYQSVQNLHDDYFPFWTPRQIEKLLDYTVKNHLLLTGNFNKRKYDKTKWYTVMDERFLSENDFVPERKPTKKRRAIRRPSGHKSRTSGVKGSVSRVEGFTSGVKGFTSGVKGFDAEVKSIPLTGGTYTTTEEQIKNTSKTTKERQLSTLPPTEVEDANNASSEDYSSFLLKGNKTEGKREESSPSQDTAGVTSPVEEEHTSSLVSEESSMRISQNISRKLIPPWLREVLEEYEGLSDTVRDNAIDHFTHKDTLRMCSSVTSEVKRGAVRSFIKVAVLAENQVT